MRTLEERISEALGWTEGTTVVPTVASLDTSNLFAVTAHEGKVVSIFLFRPLDPDQALQLAAWLIMGAELAGRDQVLETVVATYFAIRAT